MNNDQALFLILETLTRCPNTPGLNWPEDEKEKVTFTHWALEEALLLVWDHPWTQASEIIEGFAAKMELFAEKALTEDQHRIFSIAAKTLYQLLEDVTR